MLSNSSINRGYVLLNTLIVLIIFTSLVVSLSQLKSLSHKQSTYLLRAHSNAMCEYEIVKTILTFDYGHEKYHSNECDETIVTYEFSDDTVSIMGSGKSNFRLKVIIDLEMRVVKMYNYNAQ